MKIREMDRLSAHFDRFFGQTNATVIHLNVPIKPHIDVLLYPPNKEFPFWKLATMGASDYKMPKLPNAICDRNEYLMFVAPEVDLKDPKTANFYHRMLMEVAYYPPDAKTAVTYGHSMEWGETEGSDMIGAFIEFPQIIPDSNILRCKLGLLKTTACLQVVLLTAAEIERLKEIGPEKFSYFLYPEDENAKNHFLSEQIRSDKF